MNYEDYLKFAKVNVNVDASFRCRLQCPGCMRQTKFGKEKIKRSEDISVNNFIKLLKYFDHILLCGQISDSIYHPNFLDLLKIKFEHYSNKRLSIHTNGSGKNIEWWKQVYSYSDNYTDFCFGLDGFSQETANQYRIGTKYDDVIKAMLLGGYLKKNIRWRFMIFKHNEHEIELAKKFALENNITFELTIPNRFGSTTIEETTIDEYKISDSKRISKKYVWKP